jgi:hypothetical protein
MNGPSGKGEGSDRVDGMSTDVSMPSQQLAHDALAISRVITEQRGRRLVRARDTVRVGTENALQIGHLHFSDVAALMPHMRPRSRPAAREEGQMQWTDIRERGGANIWLQRRLIP